MQYSMYYNNHNLNYSKHTQIHIYILYENKLNKKMLKKHELFQVDTAT